MNKHIVITFLIKQKDKITILKIKTTQYIQYKKPRPDQTAGQGKGLWAEASFGLDFLNTFLSRKKYE